MAALSLQFLGNKSDASEPIIEDITELCKSCIKLTEVMVTIPENPYDAESIGYEIDISTQGFALGTCRLCKIIWMHFYTQRQQEGLEGSPLTPLDSTTTRLKIVRVYRNDGMIRYDLHDPH